MDAQKKITVPVGPHHEAIGELFMANRALIVKIEELEKMLSAMEQENKDLKAKAGQNGGLG